MTDEKLNLMLKNSSPEFCENLLMRLKKDCDFFLGQGDINYFFGSPKDFGQREELYLWGYNVADHIRFMKICFEHVKPEWLTMDDIISYEEQMTA